MINYLQNLRARVFPDKWHFDLSQDWETFAFDFRGFSTDDIADKTLQALGFHISATGYLQKRFSYFINVTNLEFTIEPAVVNNSAQVVRDSEEEVVKKKNKRATKRKERLAKLHTSIRFSLSSRPESSLFLLPHSVSVPVPTLVPALVPTLIPTFVPASLSHFRSFVILLSGHMPAPATVSCCGIPALILLLPVLGPSLLLRPSLFRILKQSLSDEPWPRVSTSPAKSLCAFPALGALNLDNNNGLYNSTNNNKPKQGFDITFINSCPLAGNHD